MLSNAQPNGAITPPTQLPPLGRLYSHSSERIGNALANLRFLYFPPISPSNAESSRLAIPKRSIRHKLHDNSVPDSGYASAEEEDEEEDVAPEVSVFDSEAESEADIIRADTMERAFAIKWLTGFIVRAEEWVEAGDCDDFKIRSEILEDASALLSAFTGSDEDDQDLALTRTFAFPFGTKDAEGLNNKADGSTTPLEIQVELNDAPLSKDDHTSVGLQSWGSSIILGERVCIQPSLFSLVPLATQRQRTPLRILELGAGTGLLSIIADKILASYTPKVPTEIVATDYHPDVLNNLAKNVETNFPSDSTTTSSSSSISVQALDWETPIYDGPLSRSFDVILAADVVYHPDHARWIKGCVEHLLAKPSENPNSVFWLIIAVRRSGRHEGMDDTVDELFVDKPEGDHDDSVGVGVVAPRLRIFSREEISKQGGIGRADEDVYRLFKIGWA